MYVQTCILRQDTSTINAKEMVIQSSSVRKNG